MRRTGRQPGRPLLVPPTVLVEACWILNDRAGPTAQAALLDSVAARELELTSLLPAEVARMAQLVRTYHDLRLDPADARAHCRARVPVWGTGGHARTDGGGMPQCRMSRACPH
ncbi:MAG: hypothetical protein ACRDNZ_24170 [Streptosporangiaceae bacterium]